MATISNNTKGNSDGINNNKDDWYKEFTCKALPDRVRCCRKHFGLKQEEFAYRIGLSQTSLSKIESGKSQPSIDTLTKMENVLRVPEGYLYAEVKSAGNADVDDLKAKLTAFIAKEIQENDFSIEQLENIRFTIHEYSRFNKLSGCSA